jgi:zinc transport system permease protein
MLQIFHYDFMVRAFIAGVIVSIIAPMIGVFLVARRYSLLADTLAHVSLVGVAAAVIFGINPIIGALAVSGITAIGIEKLRATRQLFGESILALFLSGSLAIALLLLGVSHGLNLNIVTYLFGSITTVTLNDVYLISGLGALVLMMTLVLFKKFFLVSYDEDFAKASGVHAAGLNIVLLVLAAITVSLSMRMVGTLLVGALMVIPVLTAVPFGKSFTKTAMLSIACSLFAVIVGLVASFYLNVPSGGTIVIVALLSFLISMLLNPKRGS